MSHDGRREQASALVQAGETVRHAVQSNSGPFMASALGPLGVKFLTFRTVAVTDKAVYLMSQKATGGPKAVEQRLPLGSVAVSYANGPALNGTIVVGDQKMRVLAQHKAEAQRLAAAASGG